MGYLLRRLLAVIPVLAIVGVLVFAMLRLTPGDPAAVLAGDYATPEQVAAIRTQMGLDRPVPEQLLTWTTRILSGDLGVSIFSQQPVSKLIRERVEPTVVLTVVTVLLAVAALSVFIALWNAVRERRADLAMLRMLGAPPGRVAGLVLWEALWLAAMASVLGLLLGHGTHQGALGGVTITSTAKHAPQLPPALLRQGAQGLQGFFEGVGRVGIVHGHQGLRGQRPGCAGWPLRPAS
eukprot:gene37545-46318_t